MVKSAAKKAATERILIYGVMFERGETDEKVSYQHTDQFNRTWILFRNKSEGGAWHATVLEPGEDGRCASLNDRDAAGEGDDPLAHIDPFDSFELLRGLIPLTISEKWPTD